MELRTHHPLVHQNERGLSYEFQKHSSAGGSRRVYGCWVKGKAKDNWATKYYWLIQTCPLTKSSYDGKMNLGCASDCMSVVMGLVWEGFAHRRILWQWRPQYQITRCDRRSYTRLATEHKLVEERTSFIGFCPDTSCTTPALVYKSTWSWSARLHTS